jgi:hypothetical protein
MNLRYPEVSISDLIFPLLPILSNHFSRATLGRKRTIGHINDAFLVTIDVKHSSFLSTLTPNPGRDLSHIC